MLSIEISPAEVFPLEKEILSVVGTEITLVGGAESTTNLILIGSDDVTAVVSLESTVVVAAKDGMDEAVCKTGGLSGYLPKQ